MSLELTHCCHLRNTAANVHAQQLGAFSSGAGESPGDNTFNALELETFGNVTEDTTVASHLNIRVTGVIEVRDGSTFQIEAPNELAFEEGLSLIVRASTLITDVSDTVIFRGTNPMPGFWNGIAFENSPTTSYLGNLSLSDYGDNTYFSRLEGEARAAINIVGDLGGLELGTVRFASRFPGSVEIHADPDVLDVDCSGSLSYESVESDVRVSGDVGDVATLCAP